MRGCGVLRIGGLRTAVTNGRVLGNVGLAVGSNRVRTVVKPGNSNGSALDTILANGPLCAMARNRTVFGNGGLLSVGPRSHTHRKLFLSFRCPIRVPNMSVAGFVHTTVGTGHRCRNLRPLGADRFVGLVHRGHRLIRLSDGLTHHSMGRNFSNNRGGHGRVFRVTVLRPGLSVLSRASSNLSISTVHVITSNIGGVRASGASTVIVARCRHLLSVVGPDIIRILCGNEVIGATNPRLTGRVRTHNCS